MEGAPGQALELRQPDLGESPEAPVYVDGSVGELVPGMADASVAEVDRAAAPAVGTGPGPTAALRRWPVRARRRPGPGVRRCRKRPSGTAAAPALDPTRRSFPPQCRTADAGPCRPVRSLKARRFTVLRFSPLRRLAGGRRRSSERSRGFWPRKFANAWRTCFSLSCRGHGTLS